MKREFLALYRVAEACRAIAALASDKERDAAEFSVAMTAIRELATTAHDLTDHALRSLNNDPGIGYMCAVRRELDERSRAAP